MNISTPVDDKMGNDFLIDDGAIIEKSLLVAKKLEVYLHDLKIVVKNSFSNSKEDNKYQSKLHGLAWVATYVEALKQMSIWADELYKSQNFKKAERTILILSFNEYLNQLFGGIMMSQNEIIRPVDLDYKKVALGKLDCEDVLFFRDEIDVDYLRSQLIELIIRTDGATFIGNDGLNEDQTMIRQEFYKFAKDKIEPFAHAWHLKDELIPLNIIEELADLGVFGLTIPEEFGGTGLD